MSSTTEKGSVLPINAPLAHSVQPGPFTRLGLYIRLAVVVLGLTACLHSLDLLPTENIPGLSASPGDAEVADLCPQASPLIPQKNGELWEELGDKYGSDAFLARAVDWLSGAVKVPTPSFDKMGPVGDDPRWEVFAPFHEYLLSAYPLIHSTLELTKVNTYGLVYLWKGSDESLKPLLLTAHQDVVPVNPDTVDDWTHPPFSGYFDGESIWGRGSSDDKSGLIGVMSTVENLLENGFKPTRSVVLAFGFDEETSGLHGAAAIADYLLETYGENGFALLVDEGGGFGNQFGGVFANLAIAEKGYIDVRVEVTSPGGHSSVPPPHTTIGILASLLVHFEENPYEVKLARGTPMYLKAQCLAAHAPVLPKDIRKAIKKASKSDRALREAGDALFELDGDFRAFTGTTQAIDLINGGVKTNALPEQAWAVVNHRIATDSSVDEVKKHDTALLKSLAGDFNLSITAFGDELSQDAPAYGTLTLSDAWGTALEPAPDTPVDAAPYTLLSGTIKAAYNSHRSLNGDNIIVSPGIMSGNTDTRYYWKLTEHIFRYNHHNSHNESSLAGGVHTVNEHLPADAFIEMIRFFTALILNADETEL
ncbi:carboxypeptidase S [Obba rivulosa]|uniref:Carboxypeptidase S n=1 Tax=Obba rivulosa TaxID=1052685 RepID=A0A8E2DPZ1_9APHY|nr:carboxypeptidase S [Obba rivulosa]